MVFNKGALGCSLPRLQSLLLDHNQINVIQSGVFDNLPSLQNLYLNDNQISILPPNIFKNLSNLKLLYFRNNNPSCLQQMIESLSPKNALVYKYYGLSDNVQIRK